MPELPEVETIVRDLRPQLEARVVERAYAAEPGVLRYPGAGAFAARLPGQRMVRVGRHGKFIMIDLEGEAGEQLLVIHLGMTGRLGIAEPESDLAPHTHLRLLLSSGAELRMQDPRRFGRVLLGTLAELRLAGKLPLLGPEPGSQQGRLPPGGARLGGALTLRDLGRVLGRSHRAVKAVLLDQAAVAGLGNIYADEACFRAGVRPQAISARLGPERRRRLYVAIHDALDSAVNLRGSSIDDYRDGFGEKGQNQHVLLVYGRAGQPCSRCDRTLLKTVVAGRTTVYCPRCQR